MAIQGKIHISCSYCVIVSEKSLISTQTDGIRQYFSAVTSAIMEAFREDLSYCLYSLSSFIIFLLLSFPSGIPKMSIRSVNRKRTGIAVKF